MKLKQMSVLPSAIVAMVFMSAAVANAGEKKDGGASMCRCPMHAAAAADDKKAETEATDPAALLAAKNKLDLSEKQVKKLEKILANARRRAKQLLTEAQREKLEKLSATAKHGRKTCKMMASKKKEDADRKTRAREQKQKKDSNKKKPSTKKSKTAKSRKHVKTESAREKVAKSKETAKK